MYNEKDYLLRIKGIEEGRHQMSFKLRHQFFKELNHDALSNVQFDCNLSFEKKGDLITMDFTFKGMVNVACDRCTTDIALPIDKSFRLWASFQNVKDNHERNESLDQEDWIFLEEKQDHIDLKQYLVDFSVLSVPTQFRYDCREKEPYPCDENVLNQIGYFEVKEEKKESSSSIWKDLKSINWD